MRPVPPGFICSRTYALFFHRFPVVPKSEFWHNKRMPNRAEKNAAIPAAVLSPAHPESALPTIDPSDDRAVSEEIPGGDDRLDDRLDDRTASPRPREIGGPAGPEPTRFGDWEKKGRCIDF
jgi:Protein of unknown function (DUF1674)